MKKCNYFKAISIILCLIFVSTACWVYLPGPVQASAVTINDYNYYFGGFHSHTSFSEDTGNESAPPSEAYRIARDQAGADFMSVTDHAHYLTDNEWADLKSAADTYNQDGQFVALAGYEMTANFGHMNVLYLPSNEKPVTDNNINTWYYKLKNMPGTIAQFNHPGKDFGDFGGFINYSAELDNVINLYEMSCGEMPIDSPDYTTWVKNPEYLRNYVRALDAGWHVGPVNNQDNHYKSWLIWNECRAVVLANSLTRNDIYDALKNRRVYGTEDKNKKIFYSVNGSIMGSILDGSAQQLSFVVDVQDPDSADIISKIEIIADGGRVVQTAENIGTKDYHWEFVLPAECKYYFVKVIQADGKMSVTAPVWTGKPAIWISGGSIGETSPINVRISDLPDPVPGNSWIGLYEEGAAVGGEKPSIWWMYLSGMQIVNGGTSFVFNPSSIPDDQKSRYAGGGRYKFVIAYNDSYNVEASTSFEVKAKPRIELSEIVLPSNQSSITVTVTNPEVRNSPTDWIGIYEADVTPAGAPPAIWWEYLPNLGITNGSGQFTFNPANAFYPDRYIGGGSYKFVLCYDDSYNVESAAGFSVSEITDPVNITAKAELIGSEKQLTVSGNISTGAGKKISIVILDDKNQPCKIDQIVSGENGVFTVTYDLKDFKAGRYKVKVSGEGVSAPVIIEFKLQNRGSGASNNP